MIKNIRAGDTRKYGKFYVKIDGLESVFTRRGKTFDRKKKLEAVYG